MKGFYKKLYLLDSLVILGALVFCECCVLIGWHLGNITSTFLVGITIFLALCIFVFLGRILFHDGLDNIREYCKKTGLSMEQLESDFKTARKFGARLREGNQWIYYMNPDSEPDIIKKSDITYVKFHTEHLGRTPNTYMFAYTEDNQITKIPMSKKKFKKLREAME